MKDQDTVGTLQDRSQAQKPLCLDTRVRLGNANSIEKDQLLWLPEKKDQEVSQGACHPGISSKRISGRPAEGLGLYGSDSI